MTIRYTQPAFQAPAIMEPGTAIGYLLGQALAGNVERNRVKGLSDWIASQSKGFTDPAQVTDADTQAAQQNYAQQNGFAGLIGKDGFQSLADQQQQWKSLDTQKQQLLAKGDAMTDDDKATLNAIGQRQDLIHNTANSIRTVLQGKNVNLTGYGEGDDAQTSFLNQLGALQQAQNPNQNSVAGALGKWISSQPAQATQNDIPNSRKGQPLPTVGAGHATVQTDQETGRIDVNRTSILPPNQKVSTSDIVKAAQQPNATLSFADLAGQDASPAVAALAKQLAQQRADASFQPVTFLSQVQQKAAQAGLSDEDYNRVMAQATGLASAKADQLKQAKNQVLIQNLVQQMQGAGSNIPAALVQYLAANGIKPADLAAHFPNAKYVSVDTGGATYRMPEQGAGWGSTLGLQNTTKPDTVYNGKVKMTTNANDNETKERNNIRDNTTSTSNNIRSNNTTLTAKQMETEKAVLLQKMASRDKDKSLEAAKIAADNFTNFEKTRSSSSDTRVNPYSDLNEQAQQILNGKMNAGGVSNKTAAFQLALSNMIESQGADAAKAYVQSEEGKANIRAAGLDPDVALTWIP